MFHPPQAAIGLALLPVAWAAEERAREERGNTSGSSVREREGDLARYFPPGWNRETVPAWPVDVAPRTAREAPSWRGSGQGVARLSMLLRRVVRRMKGLVPGALRG